MCCSSISKWSHSARDSKIDALSFVSRLILLSSDYQHYNFSFSFLSKILYKVGHCHATKNFLLVFFTFLYYFSHLLKWQRFSIVSCVPGMLKFAWNARECFRWLFFILSVTFFFPFRIPLSSYDFSFPPKKIDFSTFQNRFMTIDLSQKTKLIIIF